MKKIIVVLMAAFCLPLILAMTAGCSAIERRNNMYKTAEEERPLVDEKYSLSSDRNKMEELRKDVPTDKKKKNDDLAIMLQEMSELQKHPNDIREKFNKILRKKREIFDRDMTKERDQFTKTERKTRDTFLKQMDEARKDFTSGGKKPTKDQRDEFFKDQSTQRSEYFANEREKRNDFESDVRERRRSFEDYVRETTNEFNQEHRAYYKRWEEMKKEKERQKAVEKEKQKNLENPSALGTGGTSSQPGKPADPGTDNEVKSFLQELEEAKSRPGVHLESGE